jgi:hypothetical protein
MLEVKLDGLDVLAKKLDELHAKVKGLHHAMPQELEAWQRDDMHRRFPNTKVDDSDEETVASTEIWPRSRLPSKDQHHHQGPKQHAVARASPRQHVARPLKRSSRPILRAELLQKLHDRMIRLVAEAMKWP